MTQTWFRDDGYEITTDRTRIDVDVVHAFLATAYWSENVPQSVVEKGIAGALCFSVFAPDGTQAGFGRVVTDYATFAYFTDIFVLDAHRGRALGKWMVRQMIDHAALQGLRRWMLGTRDAHGLYAQFGFENVPADRLMSRSGLPDGRYPAP